METAFPLAALQRKKHFSPAVKITEPLRILFVLEMRPQIVMKF